MDAQKATYPISLMARVLGVTWQGYYAWQCRAGARARRSEQRRELDRVVAWEFDRSGRTYGAPRIATVLRRAGEKVGVRAVAASMRRQGLEAVSTRQFRQAGAKRGSEVGDHRDHCQRVWDKGGLDRVWVTDFTYLRCGEGWVYLCVVRDAHSRRVLGWATSSRQDTDTLIRALDMARERRGRMPVGVVLHADRGCQFTSRQLDAYMRCAGGKVSMGRTGVCWDNAMAESFWATLKVEYFYRHAFATRAQVHDGVGRWIEQFYNRTRIHTALGGYSPIEYELHQQSTWAKAA